MLLGLYFFALVLTKSFVSGELSCFYNYTLYSNNCYRFYSSPLSNYNEALKICVNDGADLASIHNAFENSYIWSNADASMLIGLRYNPDRDVYQWSDDSVLDYKNYDNNFESQRDYLGYCAQNVKGKWTNAECEDDKLPFVCKTKAVDVPETPTWACPDPDIFYETPGDLFSPGYPDDYDLNTSAYPDGCLYKLAAKNRYRIRIHIQEFSMKNNSGNIIVYKKLTANAANEIARIDERYVGGQLFVESNVVLLSLSSSYSGKWKITWSAEELPSTTAGDVCPIPNIIYTESETIYSPGYPHNFEFSLNTMTVGCYYKLIAQKGYYIEIKIDEISLDLDEARVDIYRTWKAETEDHVVIFKNRNLEQTIKVNSDEVLIRVWNSYRGFYKISWRTFRSENCNSDWKYFNGSCYIQGTNEVIFDVARSYCSSHNSHPVYIETAEEQQFLESWVTEYPAASWLGLTMYGNGHWIWLNNEPLTYKGWWADEPDGCCGRTPLCGIYAYATDQKGAWGDYSCSDIMVSPLCEREASVLS